MRIKYIFIVIPLLLILFLLQSFFWVPTFDDQSKGGGRRLAQFVEGAAGDASILNPILAADSSSSSINSLIFDSLLDYDEELRLRPRLAESWKIYEEVLFFAHGRPAQEIADRIEKVRKVSASLADIEKVEILPREELKIGKEGEKEERIVKLPPRIKLTLTSVAPDIFKRLEPILGKDYFDKGGLADYIGSSGGDLSSYLAYRSIPVKEHNPVILFDLRRGVKFHDGAEFTANDVLFTYRAIMDPASLSPRVSDFTPIKKAEAVDRYRIKVTYNELYSPAIGSWMIGILPEHLLNQEALKKEALEKGEDPAKFTMRDSGFNRNPVGCGPFKFSSWRSDEEIRLVSNDKYWEGAPNYEEYIYRIIPDSLGQEIAFYGGALDSYSVRPHQAKRLQDDERYQTFSGLSFGYTYIGYNMRRDIFKDPRVRRALGMAINRDEIIDYLFYGEAEGVTGPFAKQTDFYDKNIPNLPFDPEGAVKLLEVAGWKNVDGRLMKDGQPMRFSIITNHGNDQRMQILTIVQNAWKKLGIEVSADTVEWSVFLEKHINKSDFDAVILGWSMGIEPDLYQIWHSSQSGPYQLNFVGYGNAEADKLIVQIRQEYDRDRQIELARKLHKIIYDDQPYTFLYAPRWTAVMDKRILIKNADGTYSKITPTNTGNFRYYFNRWVKLPVMPQLKQ